MPMQYESVARVGAGEATFDGSNAAIIALTPTGVVKINDLPTSTTVASAAAWQALFNVPTDGQAGGNLKYVTDADVFFSAGGAMMSAIGADPTTNGIPAPDEGFKHMGDVIRTAKFYLPVGTKMYVRLWWGSL